MVVLLGLAVVSGVEIRDCRSKMFLKYNFVPKNKQCQTFHPDYARCAQFGYGAVKMPNLLNHQNQTEADKQLASFVDSRVLQCHPDMLFLLCLFHFPVCLPQFEHRPVFPCRGLCERVKSACDGVNGREWPGTLDCSVLPEKTETCERRLGLVHREICVSSRSQAMSSNPQRTLGARRAGSDNSLEQTNEETNEEPETPANPESTCGIDHCECKLLQPRIWWLWFRSFCLYKTMCPSP